MSESSTDNQERCSFCGKSRSQVKKLIQGPAANICNECVDLCIDIMEMDVETENENNKKIESLEELPKPKELHEFLNDYIIGQDEAKKALSVAIYNHYKRIGTDSDSGDVDLQKSNILMIGPTGSGKTFLAQTMAKRLNVPFVIADATSLTEAGYVGEDVENILLKLIQEADYDIALAEKGIVYIDGLIPELIGRLPIITTLDTLNLEALKQIFSEPKNALLKQYKTLMKMDGVELDFEDDAVEEIAKRAVERETGARGLRTIVEDIMLDIMYEIPSMPDAKNVIITRDSVLKKGSPKIITEQKSSKKRPKTA